MKANWPLGKDGFSQTKISEIFLIYLKSFKNLEIEPILDILRPVANVVEHNELNT